MDISKNIISLRKKKGVTQEQLATAVNVSPQAVSKWETGVSMPDVQTMPLIAEYFEVSIDYLYRGKEITYSDIYRNVFEKVAENPQMSVESYKEALSIYGACHHGIFRGVWAKDSYDSPCPNHISNANGLSLLWSDGLGAMVTRDFFEKISGRTVSFSVPLLEALADENRLRVVMAIISMDEISIYELMEKLHMTEEQLKEFLAPLMKSKIVFEEVSKHKALGKTYKINSMYHTGICILLAVLETTREGEVNGINCCMGYGDYPLMPQ